MMTKKIISILLITLFTATIGAKDHLVIYKKGKVAYMADVKNIDSISFRNIKNTSLPFNQDSIYKKIYATLGLTGDLQPAGKPDINPNIVEELNTSFIRLIWQLNELGTDEAICSWVDSDIVELNNNKYSSYNVSLKGIYYRLYFNINLCNTFLEKTNLKTDDTTIRERAEVRFLRALNYYYLMDFFGNVPYYEVNGYELPLPLDRKNIFSKIETELRNCEADLPSPGKNAYYRADKTAVWMLLSRLYLNSQVYTGIERWTEAVLYADKIISTRKLAQNYGHLFMADNAGNLDNSSTSAVGAEIILPIYCDGIKQKAWNNSLFLIASTHSIDMPDWGSNSGWGGNRAKKTLINKFFPDGVPNTADLNDLRTAAGDDRAMFYATNRTLNITDVTKFKEGYSVMKYTNLRSDGGSASDAKTFTDTDVPLFRVAEAYLTSAEANYRLQNTEQAINTMNVLRARSHAKLFTSLTLETIRDEWAREFYFEGRRRIDLIRFNSFGGDYYNWDWKCGSVTGGVMPSYLNLYPIPKSAIDENPNIIQNPGY